MPDFANLEISSESNTQIQALVSDQNSHMGFPILQKEDELNLENNGCVELEQKEDKLNLENNGCGELEKKADELILENNGFDELKMKENNGCGELEISPKMPDFGNLLNPPNLEISSESNTQIEALVTDQDSDMVFPILQKEDDLEQKKDELILENNGCGELEQKENELNLENNGIGEDELNLENNGCDELEISQKMPDFGNLLNPSSNLEISSESDNQMQILISDQDSHLGIPILLKEDELKLENNGFGELEMKEEELILESNGFDELKLKNNGNLLDPPNLEISSESDNQMQILKNNGCGLLEKKENELYLGKNGCGELEMKEEELMLENNGCGELVMKEDELMPENNGCVELEANENELILENNGCCGELEKKENELILEKNGYVELEMKEDELNLENSGCVELEMKGDELVLEKNGYVELEMKENELNLDNSGCELEVKENQLILENNGCGDLEMKEDELILENNGCGESEMKENQLILENNGCGELETKEDQLILENNGCGELNLENNGCIELEMKENELILENNGFGELENKEDELNLENNGCVELEMKENELILEHNGCGELEMKEDELILENNGCGELEQKEDELILENNGCVELEQKEDELILENNGCDELGFRGLRPNGGGSVAKKSLDEFVKDWVDRRINGGVDKRNCILPFLVHAPKSLECSVCQRLIFPGEEVECSVRDCTGVFHSECAKEILGSSSPKAFKCPQHVCYVCNKKIHLWRCIRCPLASHDKCAAFPEHVVHLNDQPGRVICWKHPSDWRLLEKHEASTSNLEEIFKNLPLPYMEEEFKIDINWKDMIDNRSEPPPYVHIKRNVYLIKRKRDDINADIGCTSCRSTECSDSCVCSKMGTNSNDSFTIFCDLHKYNWVQSISCSKACHCSDMCSNRPFRRDRRIKLVKTELCGWGVVAAESVNKGDFIIEYIGEVIDDALCEKRLWDMKYKGVKNFYMCELRKDFTIDATFKGNLSRFLNHSCDPNCKLEKWQVEGETRVGVFAARSIEVGESLTYDYRFVQFGPEVKCHCGASNCQGYLGSKKKITNKLDICWGLKRKRTSTSCLAIIKVNSC
ncbi:uncharacterized protein LOC132602903 isoform X2 [Lycium barbarum]|uniref:uncharacterized protein LOC132602903 isoform X2 n=1 Tax=Lycium barbarum TaxID=112863 RepID=UPI00293E1AA6|nr:uncharacterized protein LOC132602903 isoform X2 [Lycium barbarum]